MLQSWSLKVRQRCSGVQTVTIGFCFFFWLFFTARHFQGLSLITESGPLVHYENRTKQKLLVGFGTCLCTWTAAEDKMGGLKGKVSGLVWHEAWWVGWKVGLLSRWLDGYSKAEVWQTSHTLSFSLTHSVSSLSPSLPHSLPPWSDGLRH